MSGSRGMRLVEVFPGDKALFFVACLHCDEGFGKGEHPELAYVSFDQKTALHWACVNALAGMPAPEEREQRRAGLVRGLVADMHELTGIELDG